MPPPLEEDVIGDDNFPVFNPNTSSNIPLPENMEIDENENQENDGNIKKEKKLKFKDDGEESSSGTTYYNPNKPPLGFSGTNSI